MIFYALYILYQFSDKQGTITLSITSEGLNGFKISVQDQGIGMPEDIISGRFSVADHKRRKGLQNERSAGLGLLIVKDLMELLQGNIEVISNERNGTTFVLHLPGRTRSVQR